MVAGFGPQPARGLVIGEAPGRTEVEQGRPFVGRSGQLLNLAFKEMGIDRESLYLTNVVKELPLDSEGKIRKPYKAEVDAWLLVLRGEITQTDPEAILALGATAKETLGGVEQWGLGEKLAHVVYAWHPSYVLRQGADGNEVIYGDWLEQMLPFAVVVAQ